MISKNVVLIETMDSVGTGFLYPCKYEKDSYYQYFIVFTNSHVLHNIGLNQGTEEPTKNYKGQVFLSFYDNLGKKVDQENIKEIRVYNSGNFMRNEEDIAALLVAVKKIVPMTLETGICHRQLDNREILYLEGYPGVLLEDEVCSRIQLEGMEKRIFPSNEKLGIYQITDDYHWYNDYKDRSLLQGLSGSLVYLEKAGKSEILGMAQSVSDIKQGENPFKLLYYIKFTQILKHLREANCIIFSKETENCYQIQWIYGKVFDREKKITLLLLGGSGAGKSSFAKDFAYHGNQIGSISDGQTTRTKVIYNYGILNKNDKSKGGDTGNIVDIKIMTKEEFTDRMMEKVGQHPALLMSQAIFQLKNESIKDNITFLENCYNLLQLIKGKQQIAWWPDKMLDDIKAGIHHLLSNKKMIKCYEDIIETLCTYYSVNVVKYLLDEHYIMKLRERYQQAKQENNDSWLGDHELLEKYLLNMDTVKGYCDSPADSLDVRFKEFQMAAVNELNKKNGIFHYRREDMSTCLNNEEFRKAYLASLFSVEGCFALKEFDDIFSEENQEEFINGIEFYQYDFQVDDLEDIDQENRYKEKRYNVEFYSKIEAIYGELHTRIKKYLIDQYGKYGITENNLNMHLNLNNMDDEKRKLLQKCLRVTPQGSLTGIVNFVEINDMVSDEYAVILKDLQIGTLQLIDTCGLDHVGISDSQELKNRLYETLYNYSDRKRIKLENISILYLKKLDSGKPDELRQVFPCVREVFPASPVYCVFTGIDIFYRTPDEIDSLNWSCVGDWQPKAVNYLLSDSGRKLLKSENDEDRSGTDENMYLVMRNNLIPYCGKKQMVLKNYSYYRNNTSYIWRLLASIVMKEYSSLEIINTSLIDMTSEVFSLHLKEKRDISSIVCDKNNLTDRKKKEFTEKIEKILEDTKNLIRCIFSEASLKSYNFRYNTKQADIMSFCKRNKLGYYGTYRHRLDQRFHEGYGRAVEKKGSVLAEHFSPARAALMGALKNMETKYLGSGNNLIDLKPEQKNKFRLILENMFKKCYDQNPFDEEYGRQDLSSQRDEVFDEIFNFCKGLKDEEILNAFMEEFLLCLKEQILEDNRQKSENLLKLNPEFTETLEELKKSYFEKYRTDSDQEKIYKQEEMQKKFMRLMNYYFNRND